MTVSLVILIRRSGPSGHVVFVDADLLEPDGTYINHVPSAVFMGFEPEAGQLVEYVGDSAVHPSTMTHREWDELCSPVVQAMYSTGGTE